MTENKGEQMEITGKLISTKPTGTCYPRATISLDPVDPKLVKSGDKVLVLKTVPSPSSYEPESFLKNNKIYVHFPSTPEPPQERTSMHPLVNSLDLRPWQTEALERYLRERAEWFLKQYLKVRRDKLGNITIFVGELSKDILMAFELPSEPKENRCIR
jgi:hypothetical protein